MDERTKEILTRVIDWASEHNEEFHSRVIEVLDLTAEEKEELGISFDSKYLKDLRDYAKKGYNKGKAIVNMLADGPMRKESGPFGGERPEVHSKSIYFTSQMGTFGYRFNDDGSVDVLWHDPEDYDLDDYGFDTVEEMEEYIKNYSHFDSLQALITFGDAWFCDLDEDVVKAIEQFVKE